jgi:CubicO group peptidase (beta-lactamase class C family)
VGERRLPAEPGIPLTPRRLHAILCVGLAAACNPAVDPGPVVSSVPDSGATYVPGTSWRTASPSAAGFDSLAVERLTSDVARSRFGRIDAVVIVRFGYLVVEQYVGWSADEPHTLQSVTKSVTSLLYGILRAEAPDGAADLDRPVLDVFSRYDSIANVDDRKRALTLRHLLTMRTGMDFWEQPYDGSPLQQLNASTGDWVRFVLDRPMVADPGSTWAYNSGAPILICGAIREITGDAVDDFARDRLFAPIGVASEAWAESPYDGLPHCGGGLFLTPLDLARVGYLVLRRGRWGDRQVVPAAWIDSSTTPVTRGRPLLFSSYGSAYGDFWWLFPTRVGGADVGVFAASGTGGQWLFVVPGLDLVVAVAASNGDGLDLLYDDVLPAIRP